MKSPAFQWYPKDYMTSQRVSVMSLQEQGAYMRALNFCWLDGYIPADAHTLAQLIGCRCSIKIATTVASMFKPMPGDETKLIHKRLDEERQKQEEFRARQKKNGANGGRPRKENPVEQKGLGFFGETQTQPEKSPAVSNLHSASSFSSAINNNDDDDNNQLNEIFSKRLLAEEGELDKENIEINTKTKVTEPILRDFLAHLSLEGKNHSKPGEFNKHLRNWLTTNPNFQKNNNSKNYSNGNNNTNKPERKLGRISESALHEFLNQKLD